MTGCTQAGMVAGFAALDEAGGRPRRVIGIDASAKPPQTREQIARIARDTAKLIGVERELTDDEIELDERYHAGTYGIPDDATLDAMRLAARTEGMVTDPVYEGKSMAGMIDLVTRGEIGRDPPCSTPISAASQRSTRTARCSRNPTAIRVARCLTRRARVASRSCPPNRCGAMRPEPRLRTPPARAPARWHLRRRLGTG